VHAFQEADAATEPVLVPVMEPVMEPAMEDVLEPVLDPVTEPVVERRADASPDASRSSVSVERVELGRLAWLALRVALIVTTIGALGILLLWTVADMSGAVRRFESFMRSIGFRHFHIAPDMVLIGLVMVIAGIALALATFVVLAGAVYNLLAASGGGIRLRVAATPHGALAAPQPATEPVIDAGTESLVPDAEAPEAEAPEAEAPAAAVAESVVPEPVTTLPRPSIAPADPVPEPAA